jgi:hypothetical protein
MKVFIRRSGGLANFRLQGELDTEDLPEKLGNRAEELLRVEKLRALCAIKGEKLPDAFQYEIRVGTQNDEFESFVLDDSMAGPDFLDVLDGLVSEIRRRLLAERPGPGTPGS